MPSQKIFFQISGAGHEALLVAAGTALKPGYDSFSPTIAIVRLPDLGQHGGGANFFRPWVRQRIPASGGRQMPSHWSSTRLNIVSTSSAVTTQCLHAIGCAEAGRYFSPAPGSIRPAR